MTSFGGYLFVRGPYHVTRIHSTSRCCPWKTNPSTDCMTVSAASAAEKICGIFSYTTLSYPFFLSSSWNTSTLSRIDSPCSCCFREHCGEWFPILREVRRTTSARQAANLLKEKERLFWQEWLAETPHDPNGRAGDPRALTRSLGPSL